MITLETAIAMALREPVVLDQLGEALRSDLCVANPFLRRIAGFADDFFLQNHSMPAPGDWELWLDGLEAGMTRDGTREVLGRVLAADLSAYTPAYFAPQALEQLQVAALQTAKARINATDLTLDGFATLSRQVESVRAGGLQGLARLADIDVWARPVSEQEFIPTGYPTLDRMIGGWGKELWIIFADSGVGKSMWLQNACANAARPGKRVLHITLELGLRPQIHRYYRQLAHATRAEFTAETSKVKDRLRHWFRLAEGEILMLEYPAYALDPDQLKRMVDRVVRTIGQVDIIALDYLDLMTLPVRNSQRNSYADLGRITHEVRSLCPLFDCTVLTASQAVRRPERADRLSMRDMGDSYNKVRGADGLIYLVQTPEEEEVMQGRLGVLKARDSGGRGSEVALYVNREMSIIQELDHPNTRELMRRLGHSASPVAPKQSKDPKTPRGEAPGLVR